jgi:transcriptional regulator with XRE-family HTH domain
VSEAALDPALAREVFAENLSAALIARQWNVAGLATLIDVSPETVAAWTRGEEFPCPRHFARVAMILGRTREQLLCPS